MVAAGVDVTCEASTLFRVGQKQRQKKRGKTIDANRLHVRQDACCLESILSPRQAQYTARRALASMLCAFWKECVCLALSKLNFAMTVQCMSQNGAKSKHLQVYVLHDFNMSFIYFLLQL